MNLQFASSIILPGVLFQILCSAGQGGGPKLDSRTVTYRNAEYGFCFTLPASWQGYKVVLGEWEGGQGGTDKVTAPQNGPSITIVHPRWTEENERPDIPILIMTLPQWRALRDGEFVVSASGVEPGELGRNDRYVFVLPPRYDYERPSGIREVNALLDQHAFQAPCRVARRRN